MVSIIIRAFNEDRHIGRLLDGISRQQLPTGWASEVILVDSGSTDSTVPIAHGMGAKVVRIAKEEFSFGRALNLGCNVAVGEILLFASAHIYPVYEDWISRILKVFDAHDVGVVYGRQIGNEQTRFSEHQIFLQWFPPVSNFRQQTPFCNNANCAIRRSLWLEQKYDENLTGLEDLDWAKKVQRKGWKVAYDAEAVIVHVHEESFAKIRRRYQREAIAMKAILPEVHVNLWDFLRLFLLSTISDYFAAIRQGRFFKELFDIPSFRLMQYYGTYQGHKQHGELTREIRNRFYYPGSGSRKKIEKHEKLDNRGSRKIEYPEFD